jgi:ferrous iron transport protein B
MGIESDNWPATVGVFSGLFAKEAVVGTLDSLYSNIDKEAAAATEEESFDFWGNIQASFATIPANLSELPSAFTDPLGLTMVDVKDPETAAEMQGISTGTFGAMVARFDGKVGAFAYMLFILLYFPCVAALGAIYREANLGWMLFSAGWTTGLAYWSSVLFYQSATLSQHASSSIAWIVGLLLSLVAVVGILKLLGPTGVSNRRYAEFQ